MVAEKFVDEHSYRRFLRMRNELFVEPAVTKRRRAADGFTELGTNRDRGSHALRNLFALPLGHGGDHCKKEAAGW
jgi:hypothetical protein